jgi:hypothetical protein
MLLPGGLCLENERAREVTFRPLTGEVEMAVASVEAESYPALVTAVIAAAVEAIGGVSVDASVARSLSVGDRRAVIAELACRMGSRTRWVSSSCQTCQARFDVCIDRRALPVQPAGDDYPVTQVETRAGAVTVRVPTGADQEAIAGADDHDAFVLLLRRCLTGDVGVDTLDEEDLAAVENAIEVMTPQTTETVATRCPECGQPNEVTLPGDVDTCGDDRIFEDVHRLAGAYGWSEEAIVRLPLARRRRYLGLLDQEATS